MKKRRVLCLLLCLVMLFSVFTLTACNTEEAPSDKTEDDGGKKDDTPPADPDKDKKPETNANPLYGKTIIWNGDSICYGSSAHGNWATRIAANNGLKDWAWKNYGVGGGTITENLFYQSGKERHSVCATLEQMYEEFPNADYIIIEGGTNDADLLGRITNGAYSPDFGNYDINDFDGNYNTDTFCGALESIFYRAKELWSNAKICYIVAQKMGTDAAKAENRYAYFQAAMAICEKWEIPYLNLWDDCDLDPNDPQMFDPSKSADENEETSFAMYRDGQHLTAEGYDYTTAIIEAWLKALK